ncbi:MAG: hypothetical protein WD226_02090 [Planctomycetota bacterium]
MQMFLDLGDFGRARIWLDELPDAPAVDQEALEGSVEAAERGWFLLDEVAIELQLTRSGHPAYGLLGCVFERANTGGTLVRVPVERSGGERPRFTEAFSSNSVTFGLSAEQAAGVLAGALSGVEARGTTPAGTLVFQVAASQTRSDAAIFAHLGQLCVRLLELSIEADEDSAAAFVVAAIQDWT